MSKNDIKSVIKASKARMRPEKPEPISEALKRGLDDIEILKELLGQSERLTDAAKEYIIESTKELEDLRQYRMWTMITAALMLLFLLILLAVIIFNHQVWFYLMGPITRSALILSTLGGSILLMTVVLKGVFKAASDRSKDDVLPEHLKVALELVKASNSTLKG